jgi:hypothetical protein
MHDDTDALPLDGLNDPTRHFMHDDNDAPPVADA